MDPLQFSPLFSELFELSSESPISQSYDQNKFTLIYWRKTPVKILNFRKIISRSYRRIFEFFLHRQSKQALISLLHLKISKHFFKNHFKNSTQNAKNAILAKFLGIQKWQKKNFSSLQASLHPNLGIPLDIFRKFPKFHPKKNWPKSRYSEKMQFLSLKTLKNFLKIFHFSCRFPALLPPPSLWSPIWKTYDATYRCVFKRVKGGGIDIAKKIRCVFLSLKTEWGHV